MIIGMVFSVACAIYVVARCAIRLYREIRWRVARAGINQIHEEMRRASARRAIL